MKEDKFLFEHVEEHKSSNSDVNPDKHEPTLVKLTVILQTFGLRQSLNEIRANPHIPFLKPGKAPVVEPEVPSTINTARPTSFDGNDHAMHTAQGYRSGSSLKRPFSLVDKNENGPSPQEQRPGTHIAPSQLYMLAPSESSQEFPSPYDSNGLLSSDSSPLRSLDRTPEHTTPISHKSPTPPSTPPSQGFDTRSSNAVTLSAHAVQGNHTPSHTASLPRIGPPVQPNQEDLSLDMETNNRVPVWAIPGDSYLSANGTSATLRQDWSWVITYDPQNNFTSPN